MDSRAFTVVALFGTVLLNEMKNPFFKPLLEKDFDTTLILGGVRQEVILSLQKCNKPGESSFIKEGTLRRHVHQGLETLIRIFLLMTTFHQISIWGSTCPQITKENKCLIILHFYLAEL